MISTAVDKNTTLAKNRTKSKVPLGMRTKMHVPSIAYLVIATQLPFLYALWLSLHSWNLLEPYLGRPFVGLGNYAHELVSDPAFWPSVGHTGEVVLGSLAVALVIGTLIAILLYQSFPGRNVLRTAVLVPFLITPVVTAVVWKNLVLSPSFGLIDWVVRLFGGQPVPWLSSHPMLSVVAMTSWEWIPFFFLVITAGLQAVPYDLIEAAQVDGANSSMVWWKIVLPHLRHYYEVAVLLGTVFIFQTFGKIYLATAGGPGIQTTTLPYYTYKVAFQYWEVGQAAAIGVYGVILAIILAQIMVRYFSGTTQETM